MLSSGPRELFTPSQRHIGKSIEKGPQSTHRIRVCALLEQLLDVGTELCHGDSYVVAVLTTSVRYSLKGLVQNDERSHRANLAWWGDRARAELLDRCEYVLHRRERGSVAVGERALLREVNDRNQRVISHHSEDGGATGGLDS